MNIRAGSPTPMIKLENLSKIYGERTVSLEENGIALVEVIAQTLSAQLRFYWMAPKYFRI